MAGSFTSSSGVGVVLAAELGGALLRAVLRAVPQADELRAGALLHRGGVQDGDVAGADEADADGVLA